MVIDYDFEGLENALDDFQSATGVIIELFNTESNRIGRGRRAADFCELVHLSCEGKSRCLECDKKMIEKCSESRRLEITECHAGLIDSAIPLIFENKIIGYIILGQMKQGLNFGDVYRRLCDLGIDKDALCIAYEALPVFSNKRINGIANIAVMLAEYIMLSNMLKAKYDPHTDTAVKYIEEHYSSPISSDSICKSIGISKSSLYYSFKKQLGCTVHAYINRIRIGKAKEMLKSSEIGIEEISAKVGFENYTYFCKIFKALTGTTALKYRKEA